MKLIECTNRHRAAVSNDTILLKFKCPTCGFYGKKEIRMNWTHKKKQIKFEVLTGLQSELRPIEQRFRECIYCDHWKGYCSLGIECSEYEREEAVENMKNAGKEN